MFRLIRLLLHWNLMRSINLQDGIVPEWLFDYWGHQHTVGHLHSYYYANQLVKNAKILDLGCGSGYGSEFLASTHRERTVIAADCSSRALRYCRLMRKGANLHFCKMDVGHLAFPDESFDLVASFEVMEHLIDYKLFLSEVKRVLKPGGYFVLATPNSRWRLRHGLTNPFHHHEFTYEELRYSLKQYFDNIRILCRCFWTTEAKKIVNHIDRTAKLYRGVRLLTERTKKARLMHLFIPFSFRDRYFYWRTGYPLNWYKPHHIELKVTYSDEAYAFLATMTKL